MAAAFLVGCSEDPGLQERLNRLQAEMQEKERQLQDAQSALEKTKSELKSARSASTSKPAAEPPTATPRATPQSLSKGQLEESYASATQAMQKRMTSELRNYSVEKCTQFPVVMPSDEYPYQSKVGLTVRSDSGRAYRLEFPVSADTTGKWSFPTSVDIAGALADNRQQEQNDVAASTPTPTKSPAVAQSTSTPTPIGRSTAQSSPQLVPGQTSTETRVIEWGSHPSSTSRSPQPTPPVVMNPSQQAPPSRQAQQQQQPTPQQSRPAQQAMPSDKDVTIHW